MNWKLNHGGDGKSTANLSVQNIINNSSAIGVNDKKSTKDCFITTFIFLYVCIIGAKYQDRFVASSPQNEWQFQAFAEL